jgi:hypothetical protein
MDDISKGRPRSAAAKIARRAEEEKARPEERRPQEHRRQDQETQGPRVTAPRQQQELEALLALSRRSRAKLDRLREVLTSPGHYGKGATPAAEVHRENKLRLLRLLDESGRPFTGPPVLFIPAPVSRYFIIDLLPGRSFAAHIAKAGFDVFVADFGEPTEEDRFGDLDYYVEGLVRRCVRKVLVLTGQPNLNLVGYCLGGTLSLLYAALHPTWWRGGASDHDGRRRRSRRHRLGGTPHGAGGRVLRQPAAGAGGRSQELV